MKVLLISLYYPPEANSTALKISDLAQHLTESGHEVSVVTGFPNYPDCVLYQGYRRSLLKREDVGGVRVLRTFLSITSERRSFGPRMKNYLSFMVSSIYGGLAAGRQDVVYASSPPLFLAVSGYAISRSFRAPLVLDVNDLWPQAPIQLGIVKNPRAIRAAQALERFAYEKSDRIFFYSHRMRQMVLDTGVPAEKTEVHPLWVDTEVFKPVPRPEAIAVREKYGMGDRLVIMYAGNIGLPQGLQTAIECARLLKERKQRDVLFVFVGGGADRERLMQLSQSYGLDNVLFIPSQPLSSMPAFMSASDALLLHLDKAPFRLGTIPGKLFAYMSCGRPVLLGLEGEGADLVRDAGCGVVIEPQNPESMAEGIARLSDPETRARMGEASRRTAVERYDRRKVLATLERRLEDIVTKRNPNATRAVTS